MSAGEEQIYRSIKFDRDTAGFSKWPKLSCSAATDANELVLATPPTQDDPNPGDARLAIDGALKLKTGVAVNQFSSDRTLAGNSDLTVPTEKAVKAYIDTQITHVNQALSAKAALAGASSQDFQAKNLTVSGSLTTAGNVSINGNVGIGTTNPKAKLDVAGNINISGIISGASLPPNLIRNSYMNILDGTKPAGYSVLGNVTLEAVHPFTKGFEGPYVHERPPNAASSVDTATQENPYWFGVYYKGSRASRGGLADGWGGLPDGKLLKITGNNSVPGQTCVFFPFESNVLTNKVRFKAWLKIVSGAKVGFGVDAGYYPNNPLGQAGLIITKEQTDAAPDGWYQIDAVVGVSEVTSLGGTTFSMGIEANGIFEVYLALPYLTILDNDTWLPSVSDMLSRDGLTVHPSSGNVGIGTTSPGAKLDIKGRTFYRDGLDFGDTAADGLGKVGMISWGSEQFVVFGRAGWGLGLGANGRYTDIYIRTSGNVGIGTVNPQYPLHLNGGAYCTGTQWKDASSIEYKEDVVPLTLDKALETLANLNPVTFRYKVEEDKKHVGFIAEEVPDLVASKDRKGLSSMDIVGVLTKVVQHQQKEIEELKARLNEGR